MFESACSSDDLPAFGGPTSAIWAGPRGGPRSSHGARPSCVRALPRFGVRPTCGCPRTARSWSPGSSPRIFRASWLAPRSSLPTSRRLISCICVRCGTGIAITFPSIHAGRRALRAAAVTAAVARPFPAAARTLDAESGRSACLVRTGCEPGAFCCAHRAASVAHTAGRVISGGWSPRMLSRWRGTHS